MEENIFYYGRSIGKGVQRSKFRAFENTISVWREDKLERMQADQKGKSDCKCVHVILISKYSIKIILNIYHCMLTKSSRKNVVSLIKISKCEEQFNNNTIKLVLCS